MYPSPVGVSIYPNYHSLMKPLAMHAYDPGLDSQTAFLFAPGGSSLDAARGISEERGIEMTDVRQIAESGFGS